MKHTLTKLALCIAFITVLSCEKSAQPVKPSATKDLTTEKAFEEFAIILSKAVSNEPELRIFLKDEALKQFDYDYDVFYPYVKYEVVDGCETFGEMLSRYDSKGFLPLIEKVVPKLTVLIPDWSWVDKKCFSVNAWDTSNPLVFVAYDYTNGSHQLVHDGIIGDILPYGSFLDIPVMVIKSNERIKEDVDVKGGSMGFSFIDESFDNSHDPKTKVVYDKEFEINLGGAAENSDWVSKMKVNGLIRSCYSITKDIPGAAQRDYVYYGMSEDHPKGYLNNKLYETIYRYKLDPTDDFYYEAGDFHLNKTPKMETNEKLNVNELKEFSWSEGKIEFRFTINAGLASPPASYHKVKMSDAFNLVKAIENRHYNFFGAYTSHYYFINKDCLAPKWIYPDLKLFTWDISNTPVHYTVQIHEVDDGATHTYSNSYTWQYATNFTRNSEAGASIELLTLKTSFGISATTTIGGSSSTSVTYTNNDDDLGTFVVQYINDIVTQESSGGVKLANYDTGRIKVCIVPTLK